MQRSRSWSLIFCCRFFFTDPLLRCLFYRYHYRHYCEMSQHILAFSFARQELNRKSLHFCHYDPHVFRMHTSIQGAYLLRICTKKEKNRLENSKTGRKFEEKRIQVKSMEWNSQTEQIKTIKQSELRWKRQHKKTQLICPVAQETEVATNINETSSHYDGP